MVTPARPDDVQAAWLAKATVPGTAVEQVVVRLRTDQSVGRAWLGGMVAVVAGVISWIALAVWLQYQVGAAALGFGMLVGSQVKRWGRGLAPRFGSIAALLTAVGIIAAHLLALAWLTAQQAGVSGWALLQQMPLDQLLQMARAQFDLFDLGIYALAIYWAYTGSFRIITDRDLQPLAVTTQRSL